MTTTLWVYHAPYTVDFELVSQLIQSVYKYESGENDNDIDVVSNCINESGLVSMFMLASTTKRTST